MFNDAKPIVPPMQDRTKGTYAETKAEIEARKHAQLAAEAAALAAAQAEANTPKKSPWLAILTSVFGVIAIAATGFAIYEYNEITKLEIQLDKANKNNSSMTETVESLQQELSKLTEEVELLRSGLLPEETPEENPENPEGGTQNPDGSGGTTAPEQQQQQQQQPSENPEPAQ